MKTRTAPGFFLILVSGIGGCATTTNNAPGQRVLDAVVIAREYQPAARMQTDLWGSIDNRSDPTGSWYLVFEARDGEATAHYRLPVTEHQYMHFQEGASVRLTLVGFELRALRWQD